MAADKKIAEQLLATAIDILSAKVLMIKKLQAERDELLAALKPFVEHAESQISQGKPDSPFAVRLRAGQTAIANVTGAARSTSHGA